MKAKWTVFNKKGDFDRICDTFGVSQITARLLINRDINEEEAVRRFLFPSVEDYHDPFLLKGMKEAVSLLSEALDSGTYIRVVGDYDVDGITATYVLTDALRRMGARVDSYIPHRIRDGYGINASIVADAVRDSVGMIITCDNGISAFEAAQAARDSGIRMIVTDHHEVGDRLPEAEVIVDPKQEDCTYPCREICGAVVAAKLVDALARTRHVDFGFASYIEFLALATVCDVVDLRGENRTIAKLGMEAIATTTNLGLRKLVEATIEDSTHITEYSLGFIIGPCLNATGRIDDAQLALKLFESRDEAEATEIAAKCVILNEERKQMTAEQEERAISICEQLPESTKVIVIQLAECHESILGIIAGRLKERYNKPTIVMTRSGDNLKGSARSIPEYNMFTHLKNCEDLMVKYGGHPMAAGLSVRPEDFDEFVRRLNEECELSVEDMCAKVKLDAAVSFNLFDEKVIEEIEALAPFGTGNPPPLFGEKDMKVISLRYIGRDNSFLRFNLQNSMGRSVTAVCFAPASICVDALIGKFGETQVNAAFRGQRNNLTISPGFVPRMNVYRDVREIQMNIRNIVDIL